MKRPVAYVAALLAIAGCAEQPNAGRRATAMERVIEENHKASEALVQAARDAASVATNQAHDAADAARSVFDSDAPAQSDGGN